MLIRSEFKATEYYLYVRKSSDERKRKQLKSIPAQTREMQEVSEELDLRIKEILEESKSAKEIGRPIFNQLLKKVVKAHSKGKLVGILIWDPSRLARNVDEGGRVVHLLQKGVIRHIQTHERDYVPTDNVQSLMSEFCDSTEYSRKLGRAIKRGYREKASEGWYPYNSVVIGYKTTRYDELKPDRDKLIPDPERYDSAVYLLKRAHTHHYSMRQLWIEAKNIGLRNKNGKPFSYNSIRHMIRSPLFSGFFYARDKNGVKQLHKGKHKHAFTMKQHADLIDFLDNKIIPTQSISLDFPYRCSLKCGLCFNTLYPERKVKVICQTCGSKFSVIASTICKKCGEDSSINPQCKIYNYSYYRCKKRTRSCNQPYLKQHEIEEIILNLLSNIAIPKWYFDTAIKVIEHIREEGVDEQTNRNEELSNRLKKIEEKEDSLLTMRLNDEVTPEKYISFCKKIEKEKIELQKKITLLSILNEDWTEAYENRLELGKRAQEILDFNESTEEKKRLLNSLCPNPIILDKKLDFEGLSLFVQENLFVQELVGKMDVSGPQKVIEKSTLIEHSSFLFSSVLARSKRFRNRRLKTDRFSLK